MGRHGTFQADQGAKPGARAPDLSTAALPPGQDFKGYLEMILQSYHTGRISYHTFESVDNGTPGLRCNLSLGQQHHNVASGFGSNKEEAEQRAARVCLAAIDAGTLRLRPK